MTYKRMLELILTLLVMIALHLSGEDIINFLTDKELEELGNLTDIDLKGIYS